MATTKTVNDLFPSLDLSNIRLSNSSLYQKLNSIIGSTNNKNSGSGNFLAGNESADTLSGRGNDDVLLGGAGNDLLGGQGGNDVLMGGSGNDQLSGDGGDDHLLYQVSKNMGTHDLYEGGANSPLGDTLWLAMTWGEYNAYQQEISSVRDLLAAQKVPKGISYDFKSFGLSISNIENLEVLLTNSRPTAVRDDVRTDENTPITINVLGNDFDPDAMDKLAVMSWDTTSIQNGTLKYNEDGSFTFNPNEKYEALAKGETDVNNRFTYVIGDLAGAQSTATANITIEGMNDAPVVAAALASETDEDQVPYMIDLLAGASDVDNGATLHAINISEVNGLTAGWRVVGDMIELTPGAYSEMNDEEFANLKFSYQVTDEYGATVDQALQVKIAGITDGPPLEIAIAQGSLANEFLLTITTKELIGIDRVHVGFEGLPEGVKVTPLTSPGTDPTTLLRDFVDKFGESATFTVTLPTDADVFSEFKVTAEGYRRNELVTGTTKRTVDIDYDVAQTATSTLSFEMADQSIWGDFSGAIGWHEYIPIIGGEAIVWDDDDNLWTEALGDTYWHSGEIDLVDFHVSTEEAVQEASNKLNSISGVVAAWSAYDLDKIADTLADAAYAAAELADNVLESALQTASNWKYSAQSAYNNAVSYKNVQYNEMMATAYDVRGLFGEYWFTWYDPIQVAEYAAAEVAVGATWTNFEAAKVSYNGAYWALTNNDRYIVEPLRKAAVATENEMQASLSKANSLENAMHAANYYTDLSYAEDTWFALSGAAAAASLEYALAKLTAMVDFSADLQLDAEVYGRLGLQIDFVLDSGTVDAEVDYELTSKTQYNQTTDMLTITPQLVNLTTGDTVAFSTESPNVKFSAALLYDVGANLDFMLDGRLVGTDTLDFDLSPNSDGIHLNTSVSLDDLAYQELDLDGDGDVDAVVDLESETPFLLSDIDNDGDVDATAGLGIELGKLVLVDFDSTTDLEPIGVPLVETLTEDVLSIEVALPYIATAGTLQTGVTPADFYDEGQFIEVDFSEISSAFFNMLDARIDFGEEFMEAYGLTSLTDEQTLQSMFASVANGVLSLVLDQLDGQSEGMPIFVIDTTDETDTSLLHLNLWEDPAVNATAGSFGFYAAYGESEPIVNVTLDLDQLVAVIVNHVVLDVLTGGAYEGAQAATNLPIINPLNINVGLDTILKLAYISDDDPVGTAIKSFVDFGYTFEAADYDVNATANFGQKFGFSIDEMTYVVRLEDETVLTFNASENESLTIANASNHDTNGDGSIDYSFEIVPTAMFSNDTELGFSLGYTIDFLKGSLEAGLKLPIGGLGSIPLPGIDIALGPLLRVEGELDTLDIDVFESRFGVDVGSEEFSNTVDIQLVGTTTS